MAIRDFFHKKHLQPFLEFLGDRALPPKGDFEIVRWKGPEGQPMRIIFRRGYMPEHYTVNDAGWREVKRFVDNFKNQGSKNGFPTI